MAVAGPKPTLYTAYIAIAKDPNQQWTEYNCYLHKIRVVCLSDLNLNGESDPEDILLFTAVYAAYEAAADLNEDGAIDEQDYTLFWEVYTHGCGAE